MKTSSTPDHEVIELFLASSDHLINGLVIGYFIFLLRYERKQRRVNVSNRKRSLSTGH